MTGCDEGREAPVSQNKAFEVDAVAERGREMGTGSPGCHTQHADFVSVRLEETCIMSWDDARFEPLEDRKLFGIETEVPEQGVP